MSDSSTQHGVLTTGDNNFGKTLSSNDLKFLQQILTSLGYQVDNNWTETGRLGFKKTQDQPDLSTTFLTKHLKNTTSNLIKLAQLYQRVEQLEHLADQTAVITVDLRNNTNHSISHCAFKLIPGLNAHDLEDALRRNDPLFNKIAYTG